MTTSSVPPNHPFRSLDLTPKQLLALFTIKDNVAYLPETRTVGEDRELAFILWSNPVFPLLVLEDPNLAPIGRWAEREALMRERDVLWREMHEVEAKTTFPLPVFVELLEGLRPLLHRTHPLLQSLVEIYLSHGSLFQTHSAFKIEIGMLPASYQTIANCFLIFVLGRLHCQRELQEGHLWERQQRAASCKTPLDTVDFWTMTELQHANWALRDEHLVWLERGQWEDDYNLPLLKKRTAALRRQHDDIMNGRPACREWFDASILEAARQEYLRRLAKDMRPNTENLPLAFDSAYGKDPYREVW